MKVKSFGMLHHAGTMAVKERRSYALLSVTIVLSFSLLLGYLLWTDSSQYNTYKELFSQDRNVIAVNDEKLKSNGLVKLLKEKATEFTQTDCLQFENVWFNYIRDMERDIILEDGSALADLPVSAVSIPPYAWGAYSSPWSKLEIEWLDGEEHSTAHLNAGEILLDDRLYALFDLAQRDNIFNLRLKHYDGDPVIGSFRVVGCIVSGEPLQLIRSDGSDGVDVVSLSYENIPKIAFSSGDFNRQDCSGLEWRSPILVFYSKEPEKVDGLIRSLGISSNIHAVYADQERALSTIRTEVEMKAIITAALLLILGINLYSCFSNALNDRRFEIGVKRAIGASKWSIIRQFLYESLLIMTLNILLSVWLVCTVALAYKVIYEHIPDRSGNYYTFTLQISPHSMGMFAVCSLTLTVVFSLVFAYRATQVQIVDYLKAE